MLSTPLTFRPPRHHNKMKLILLCGLTILGSARASTDGSFTICLRLRISHYPDTDPGRYDVITLENREK